MPHEINCPRCQSPFLIPDLFPGDCFTCPQCQAKLSHDLWITSTESTSASATAITKGPAPESGVVPAPDAVPEPRIDMNEPMRPVKRWVCWCSISGFGIGLLYAVIVACVDPPFSTIYGSLLLLPFLIAPPIGALVGALVGLVVGLLTNLHSWWW